MISSNLREYQKDAIRNITGTLWGGAFGDCGAYTAGGVMYGHSCAGQKCGTNCDDRAGTWGINAARQVATANENRPINIAMKYIIKTGY